MIKILFFPDGDFNYVVVINAPNLVYFRYDSVIVEGYSLSNMKSLEKADICIWFDSSKYETSATHLFQGICNVRSLSLWIDKMNVAGTRWNMDVPSCLSFHLKEIEILDYATHMIEIVRYFLDNAMVLKKLMIRLDAMNGTHESKACNQLL
ncbi:hypothetical protein J1N35_012914 [Gossypium stocksii]|uniref:FBD domain-containing protein n=1 Tax=Gossypium stocksii TaxID=47602 RepID=A0A9D3VSQ8_9ROSI|nr:hypothetical protein J1N35_012914 [Gossypium stocksii]